MLLLSLLVLGCPSVGSSRLSPDTMRTLINGDKKDDSSNAIPQVYYQLRKIFSVPDRIRNMGNTARPLILNPILDHGKGECMLLSYTQKHKLHSVKGAELHLYLPHLVPDGLLGDHISIIVKRSLPQGIRQDQYHVAWSADWAQLNITQSLDDFNFWLRNGLCISVLVDGRTAVPESWRFSDTFTDDTAFIMMWSTELLSLPQNTKSKRSHLPQKDRFRDTIHGHTPTGRNPNRAAKFGNRCSLRSFYIDFRDLGWDSWIIYPLGLEMGVCSGTCLRDDASSNYNLIINSISRDPQLHRLYSLAGMRTERTCVPTKLLPSVLMFMDEDHDIVVQLVDDIVVAGCGCV